MITDAIKDVSGRGEIVLDLFGGSGSTLIAAEKTGRRARLVELDPIYCDRILARWEAVAKDEAEQLVCGWSRPDSGTRTLEAAEMSKDDLPSRRALTARPGRDYEVGYGKPPKGHQFQKGRSGNPKSRPRGAKDRLPRLNEERLKPIVLEEAYRRITVRDGARNVTVPMAQAIVRAMAVNAAKGQHRAQRLFAELLSATETANKALADEWLDTAQAAGRRDAQQPLEVAPRRGLREDQRQDALPLAGGRSGRRGG